MVHRRRADAFLMHALDLILLLIGLLDTRLPIQKAALLHRTAALEANRGGDRMNISVAATTLVCRSDAGRREVRDVFGEGMLGANAACIDGACFAGLGEGVIAGVEVFALFEVLG